MSGIDEGDVALARKVTQLVDEPRMLAHLGGVALTKLLPSCRIVREPLSQLSARGEILQPQVHRRIVLADPARPEPIDENPHSVIRTGRLVSALQPDMAC